MCHHTHTHTQTPLEHRQVDGQMDRHHTAYPGAVEGVQEKEESEHAHYTQGQFTLHRVGRIGLLHLLARGVWQF